LSGHFGEEKNFFSAEADKEKCAKEIVKIVRRIIRTTQQDPVPQVVN